MAVRIVEWKLPYTWGTGIGIDTNKVISLLLREENNLIMVNEDNQIYTDLQLADWVAPTDEFPVGVTVGKVLAEDWWTQNGLLLNWKTTSGDYARWIYWADGEIYFDGGTGTRNQVYYSSEVNDLFTALRGELATVAFTWDYNDLINRPQFLQVQADWNQSDSNQPDFIKNKPTIPTVNDATLTIQKNNISQGTFTANSSTNTTINIPVPNVINNLTSTSTSDALSANQWKVLDEKIQALQWIGRFLSLWDASTGLPISFPLSTPYNYRTWDYFLVETISNSTNYRPNGTQYTGTASTTVETDELEVWDLYIYDWTVWLLQINHGKSVSFANLAGQPSDNANLAAALNAKADATDVNTKTFTLSSTSDLTNAQAAVDWYLAWKNPIIYYSWATYNYVWQIIFEDNKNGYRFVASAWVVGGSPSWQWVTPSSVENFIVSLKVNSSNTVTNIYSETESVAVLPAYSSSAVIYTPVNWWDPTNKTYVDWAIPTNTSQLNNDSWFITSSYHDSSKQDTLSAGTGISITSNTVANTWIRSVQSGGVTFSNGKVNLRSINWTTLIYNPSLWESSNITVSEFNPWGTATTGYVVTKTAAGYEWAAPSGWIGISSQSNNILTSWATIRAWSQADYESLWSYDNNTVYLTI